MALRIQGKEYIAGQDRCEDNAVAHLYVSLDDSSMNPGEPMCVRGWNRSDGDGYSIFRGVVNTSICQICFRRAEEEREPVPSRRRKTKWI